MKTYTFRFKDSTEIISKKQLPSYDDAVVYFAKLKKLSIDSFLELFIVE